MDLRHVFSQDILSDHKLVAVVAACLANTKPYMRTVRYRDKFFHLRPYEVLADSRWVEGTLDLRWEEFIEKIKILEKLRRIRAKIEARYVRLKFLTISFPINPEREHVSADKGIIEVSLKRWIDIDLEYVKATFSCKHHSLVGVALRGLFKVIGDVPLKTIDASHCDSWMKSMQRRITKEGTPLSIKSINNYRQALQASFERAISQGYLKENHFKELRPLPEVRKTPAALEQDVITEIRGLPPA
jgi:hypothetical protein